jgi:hypothetical protein
MLEITTSCYLRRKTILPFVLTFLYKAFVAHFNCTGIALPNDCELILTGRDNEKSSRSLFCSVIQEFSYWH